jgi:hypothetical protein
MDGAVPWLSWSWSWPCILLLLYFATNLIQIYVRSYLRFSFFNSTQPYIKIENQIQIQKPTAQAASASPASSRPPRRTRSATCRAARPSSRARRRPSAPPERAACPPTFGVRTHDNDMTLAAGAFVCVCIMHVMIYVSCCVVDKFMYLLKVLNEDDPMMSWIRFDSFCSTSVTLCILPFIYFITHMHILVIRRVLRRSRGAVQPQQVHPPQVPVPGGAALAGLRRRRRH